MYVRTSLLIIFHVLYCSAKVGDRAKEECRANAIKMPDCERVLYGSKIRVPADLLEFPHMVVIGFHSDVGDEYLWMCGGSLISPQWVLTAAHCVSYDQYGLASKLLVGTGTFEEEEAEDLVQMRSVADRVTHPEYEPPKKYHDIALLKADTPVDLTGYVHVACLDLGAVAFTTAVASGFGKTSYGADAGSKTMMMVELEIIPREICNASSKSLIKSFGPMPMGILPTQMCAGDLEQGGKDTCQGDSGGPLQVPPEEFDCKDTFPFYTVVGVTSFGRFCGYKKSPGIYTKVSEYVAWIEDVVWPEPI